MATIRFGEEDRDDQGFVNVPPRSLADLLPAPAPAADQTIQRRSMSKAEAASMIGLGMLLIALMGYLYISGDARPAAPLHIPATIPAATQTIGDGVTAPSPIPATIPASAGRPLIVFAAPDGQLLGAIESTRAITPTAHYGDDWIQADVQGSGLVWLRAADSPDLAILGPDLAPRPTVRPAAATVTPEPQPPCLTAGTGAQTVTVCDWLDPDQLNAAAAAKWIATYGGNMGIVTTPTPYGGTK